MALMAAGCGDDDGTGAEPIGAPVTANPEAPGTPILGDDALAATLLDVADLPPGFVAQPDPVADLGLDPEPGPDDSRTDPAQCGDVLAPLDRQSDPESAAARAFTGPGFTSIDQDSASYGDSAAAADAFAAVQRTLAECSEYSGTDADGYSIEYRVGAGEDVAVPGDPAPPSATVRVESTSEGITLYSDAVLVAVGPTLTQVVVTGTEPADSGEVTDLVDAAVARLDAP
ncbi:sensor domain-containing protein [Rhodococcus rhodnii]|uniref:Uncharacterized protein n=3 Tax=Rhodococcus rhodnii TaxID=38312 RepID=R7WS14_9NOCA|nr:hypothetical protein Rrhod_0448 [Rhodococcus rhodnii LMG 5362]TXG91390.1 sensor domain-containing protein [Rhodococcus rhodnii]